MTYLLGDKHLLVVGITAIHEFFGLLEHPQIRVHVHCVGDVARLLVISRSLGEFPCEMKEK